MHIARQLAWSAEWRHCWHHLVHHRGVVLHDGSYRIDCGDGINGSEQVSAASEHIEGRLTISSGGQYHWVSIYPSLPANDMLTIL